MKFLVEIDHPKTGDVVSHETSRTFVTEVIFPTLERAEHLVREGKIVAGGPVAGRIALRFIAEVSSPQELDQVITSLPLWRIADTRVTALIEFSDRRKHVETLMQSRSKRPDIT